MSTVFRPEILEMSAYKVAEAENLIKLDAMENPYTWPEDIKQQWLNQIKDCPINRYPDPEAKKLVNILKKTNNIPDTHDILLGNGSDELIQLLLMALPNNACVLSPHPGFVMYRQVALSLGLNYQSVSLLENNFELDLPGMIAAIRQYQPGIIFLAYPNNPTGNLFQREDIIKILETASGLVIIDEAYTPFAEDSLIDILEQYQNMLIMRTVSKLGLAGLRLGYMSGTQEIIEQLNKIRLPYNINSLTQLTAEFALANETLFQQQTQQICQDRSLLLSQLNQLPGIKASPSSANFILFKSESINADLVFQLLKDNGILIKNLSPQGGLLSNYLRVTVGKAEENAAFIKTLEKITLEN